MAEADTTPRQKRFSENTLNEAKRKRAEHRAVKLYLDALAIGQGPPQEDPEALREQIEIVVTELETAETTDRVRLIQRRIDLEERLALVSDGGPPNRFGDLEQDFVAVAGAWAERAGITYAALREVGVPAAVLRDAGIARTRLS